MEVAKKVSVNNQTIQGEVEAFQRSLLHKKPSQSDFSRSRVDDHTLMGTVPLIRRYQSNANDLMSGVQLSGRLSNVTSRADLINSR